MNHTLATRAIAVSSRRTLAVACKIVQHDYMLFIITFLMLALTGCYTLVFCLAEFGAYFKIEGDDDSTESQQHETIAWFSIMLLYFWTVQVFSNIVVVTVSGAAKEWWFASEGLAPVMTAFCRAWTCGARPFPRAPSGPSPSVVPPRSLARSPTPWAI